MRWISDVAMAVLWLMPFPLLRRLKLWLRWPKFYAKWLVGRVGHSLHGSLYEHHLLFVAGLSKSGTTWMEQMLSRYSGFTVMSAPENVEWEHRYGATHSVELTDRMITRLDRTLAVLKLHCPGSSNNIAVLRRHDVRVCILTRDPRDAALSHIRYIHRTPWHAERQLYESVDLREGLLKFANTTLIEWSDWIRSWEEGRDRASSLFVTYESLLKNPVEILTSICKFYGLPEDAVGDIVKATAFDVVKKRSSFYRQGVAGGWKTAFDEDTKRAFKHVIGKQLIELGYEDNLSW